MSLILDALKKSEQERRRERIPDLQSIHQAIPQRASSDGKKWGWLLLVLLNAAAVGGWWWSQQSRTDVAAKDVVEKDVVEKQAAEKLVAHDAEPVAKTAVVEQTPVAPRQSPAVDAEFTRIEPQSAVVAKNDLLAPIEEFDELGPDVRNALPAMTFSFHVYSADPQNRTIIINNQRMREGDPVSNGVVLERITEDGVILAMDHHRIHINVLTGW